MESIAEAAPPNEPKSWRTRVDARLARLEAAVLLAIGELAAVLYRLYF